MLVKDFYRNLDHLKRGIYPYLLFCEMDHPFVINPKY